MASQSQSLNSAILPRMLNVCISSLQVVLVLIPSPKEVFSRISRTFTKTKHVPTGIMHGMVSIQCARRGSQLWQGACIHTL